MSGRALTHRNTGVAWGRRFILTAMHKTQTNCKTTTQHRSSGWECSLVVRCTSTVCNSTHASPCCIRHGQVSASCNVSRLSDTLTHSQRRHACQKDGCVCVYVRVCVCEGVSVSVCLRVSVGVLSTHMIQTVIVVSMYNSVHPTMHKHL